MKQTVSRFLLAAMLVVAAAPALFSQGPPPALRGPFNLQPAPFWWWKSEPFKKELGLTLDQSARVDKIWETTRPELRQEADELNRLEDKFSRMLQSDADEAVLARQIDRVETARANANKTRSLMLMQMMKVLTPDQRSRFNTLYARWQQEQLRQPPATPSSQAPSRDPNKRPED